MAYYALVPAGGSGARYGAPTPKQYLLLNGRPVLSHALDRLQAFFPLRRLYVAVATDDRHAEDAIGIEPAVEVMRCGGATRAQTVHNALERMTGVDDEDWIVVHDAVRPCLDASAAQRLQRELDGDAVGGFLAVPVTDTLKRLDDAARVLQTESRDGLWRAQTPQMFRYGVLRRAFAAATLHAWTDEAHAVEALGLRPRVVVGSATNVKITFHDDLALAAAILAADARP